MLRQGSGLWEGLGREEHLVSGFLESHSPWEFAEPPTATLQIVLGGSSCPGVAAGMGTGRTGRQLGGGLSDTGPLTLTQGSAGQGRCGSGHGDRAGAARGVRTPSETPLTQPCLQGAAESHFAAISSGFANLGCDSEAKSIAKLHTRDNRHSERGFDSSLYTSHAEKLPFHLYFFLLPLFTNNTRT